MCRVYRHGGGGGRGRVRGIHGGHARACLVPQWFRGRGWGLLCTCSGFQSCMVRRFRVQETHIAEFLHAQLSRSSVDKKYAFHLYQNQKRRGTITRGKIASVRGEN